MAPSSSSEASKGAHDDEGCVKDFRSMVIGEEDDYTSHEVSRYVWWDSHDGSIAHVDRTFRTRRMALLYCAKLNSDSFKSFAEERSTACLIE